MKGSAFRTASQVFAWRGFVPLVIVIAVLLRVLVVLVFPTSPVSDYEWYYHRANDLQAGLGFVTDAGAPTAYWPVGYPGFLAGVFYVFGVHVLVGQLANIALAIGVLILTYLTSARLFGSRAGACLSLAVLALFPNQIAYSALLSRELLASFGILSVVYLLLRSPGSWIGDVFTGVVFAGLVLVKPQAVVLPLCVSVALYLAHRSRASVKRGIMRRCVTVYLTGALAVSPWFVRNERAFGGFVFVANSGGVNLLLGNWEGATGTYPTRDEERQLASMLPPTTGENEYVVDRKAQSLALSYIREHPIESVARIPAKVFYLYGKDADGFSWIQEGQGGASGGLLSALKVVAEVYYLAVIVALGVTTWMLIRARRLADILVPVTVIVAFTAVYAVYFGISRYHFVLVPWICIALGALAGPRSRRNVPTTSASRSGCSNGRP